MERMSQSQTQPYEAVMEPVDPVPELVAIGGLEPAVFRFQQETDEAHGCRPNFKRFEDTGRRCFEAVLGACEAVIGRHKTCDMKATNKHVSSKHLKVWRQGEDFYLQAIVSAGLDVSQELGRSGCFIGTQIMNQGETRHLVHGEGTV